MVGYDRESGSDCEMSVPAQCATVISDLELTPINAFGRRSAVGQAILPAKELNIVSTKTSDALGLVPWSRGTQQSIERALHRQTLSAQERFADAWRLMAADFEKTVAGQLPHALAEC